MAEGDSPTVARRRVRLAVREARELADLTQAQVAEEMEWSLSKVIRIENGDVSISPNDLRPLLNYLGVRDKAMTTSLIADARLARTRQTAWYQTPEFRENLTDSLRKLTEYENEATQIRSYTIYYVPGPLQTPAYSQALMTRFEDELNESQRELRIEARRRRREALLTRTKADRVRVYVMFDEGVLRRSIGGPTVFAEQLREIRRLAEEHLIMVRMVPFSLDASLTNNASFDLLVLGEGEVLYRETGLNDEMIEDRDTAAKHRARYEKVWHEAATEEETLDFISDQIRTLETGNTGRRR
ncbi:helix-turn-helix transcriptional regulator [Actinoplanes sp. NPDC051851]|uniref:helix-turn-helix domain-containing protein n=1 Tax=Actinoplanes sp. NPDC051851 TaxID=3154753 RepID=UPI00341A9A4E